MNWLKENRIGLVVGLLVVVAVIIGSKTNNEKDEVLKDTAKESSVASSEMNDEEIKNELDSTLDVLMRIHYVSIIEKKSTNPESVIVDELTESMDDLNKLKGLLYKTEPLSKSKNETIAVTGLDLHLTSLELIKAYDLWIKYLRGVDLNNPNLSEFQYQLALFQSSTRDAYLKLIEGAVLLPMVTVKFAENGGQNSFNEDLKAHFIAKIDQLFKDILIDSDLYYKKTKNRYAVAVIISGYKNFFNPSVKTP